MPNNQLNSGSRSALRYVVTIVLLPLFLLTLLSCSTQPSVKPVLVKTELADRIIRDQVSVPEELTIPCLVEKRTISIYKDAVDLSFEALESLTECNARMSAIRNLNAVIED